MHCLCSFDLIVTSDTVYRTKNYEDLHEVFDRFLADSAEARV